MPLPLPPYIGERPVLPYTGLLVGRCSSSRLTGLLVSKQIYHNRYDCTYSPYTYLYRCVLIDSNKFTPIKLHKQCTYVFKLHSNDYQ